MKNEHGKEGKKLLRILAINGRANVCENSDLDSVVAVYGMIITSSEMKDREVEICVDYDTSVEVRNVDGNATMMFWVDDMVDGPGDKFLIYVLSEEVEFLVYKSSIPEYSFFLSSIPKKAPWGDEILRKVEVLQYYKAYQLIGRKLMDEVTYPFKNKYGFVFDESIEERLGR